MKGIRQFIESELKTGRDERILVAVSGGPDSCVLAHYLHTAGYEIGIAHVNYHLRSDASNLDQALVRKLALSLGVEYYTTDLNPPEEGNIQEWARKKRYEFFESTLQANNFQKIATAHHLDDQFETVFLNLLRGTGFHGMAGMPSFTGNIIRPFLKTKRSELEAYAHEFNVPFRHDSSNEQLRYTRNQIRHQLMPILEQIGENSVTRFERSLALLEDDRSAFASMATQLRTSHNGGFEVDLNDIPKKHRGTWLYHAIRDLGFNRSQCYDLCASNNGALIESEDFQATMKQPLIVIVRKETHQGSLAIETAGTYQFDNLQIQMNVREYEPYSMPTSSKHYWFDESTIQLPLTIRYGNPDELFTPLGMTNSVVLKKYLKDKGVDRLNRSRSVVISDATGSIVCVAGFQPSELVKCTDSTKTVISLQLSYF